MQRLLTIKTLRMTRAVTHVHPVRRETMGPKPLVAKDKVGQPRTTHNRIFVLASTPGTALHRMIVSRTE